MTFLALDALTKRFGDAAPAVDALSLAVAEGECVALLGPSGCGKTTTLQLIAGFVRPTSGAITLDGHDLLAVRPAKRGLGIVFQSYALFPHMTAAENVAFGLEMQGIAAAERQQRVADVLDLVGLRALSNRYPRRMSGGQQQRVALARAIVIKPRILLLDEPLSNLDAKLREDMQIELRDLRRKLGTTTLLVTHDQSEAMALADRIVVMNRGRNEQIGAPEDIYKRPANAFVATFLGRTNQMAGEAVAGAAGGRELVIGGARWPLATCSLGPTGISIRPEKIAFVAADAPGLDGRMAARVFQGHYWLCQIDTACGRLVMITQNSGAAVPAEAALVRVGWRAEDMIVHAADSGHGEEFAGAA